MGAGGAARRSSRCCARSSPTSRRAPSSSCSPARSRATSPSEFYAELDPRARRSATSRRCSTATASRCATASRPSRSSSRPTRARPRRSSGRSSTTTRTSRWGSTRSPSSARATCSSRSESGCFALLREDRDAAAYRVDRPAGRAGVARSAPATCCSPRSSPPAWPGRPHEEALRRRSRAGAASTLELGAGIFDPREAARLQAGVDVTELTPLSV